MRQFIRRALKKIDKLTGEQTRDLLVSAATEIDRLETVLDSLTDGILVCDTRHALILANNCAKRLLPLAHYGEGSEPIWTLVRDEKAAAFFEKTLKEGDKAEEREFDLEIKGIRRLLSISILPLVRDREVSGSLIYLEDVTEKRGKEARLRRMESLASLTTLAAGVAHEIKNPLGSLSIHVQLLQKAFVKNEELYYFSHPEDRPDPNFTGGLRGPVDYFQTFHKYIGVINEEIDRLNRIVVDFLFAVRPMNMDLREGCLNALVRELAEFVRYELEAARIEIVLDLAETLPPVVFDERFMKQVLLNLVKNAQAAMEGGGRLSIGTAFTEGEVYLSVSDTGTGIPEANLPKIFEPYFTTKESGSGLGLTLVFKIIREHQGEISVKSREGEGTSFIITLPVSQKNRRLLPYGGSGAPLPPSGEAAAPDRED